MTNEERAREAAEQIGFVLDEDAAEAIPIIIAALDAATAPLVAERERLIARAERAEELVREFVEAVDAKKVDVDSESVIGEGDPEIGYRTWPWFDEWLYYARSALAEKEPG